MITVVYAFVLVALMVAPVVLLGYAHKKEQRQVQTRLRHQFEQEGATHGLLISSQELLHQAVVGIDGQQRKLLLAWKEEAGFYRSRVIDLNNLKHCTVQEELYADENPSVFSSHDDAVIDRVVLHLESFAWPATVIPFYDASLQSRRTLPLMREKAGKWMAIITALGSNSSLLERGNLAQSG